MSYLHWAIRARKGRLPFLDQTLARWVWQRLQASFPEALAAIFMPNHLHLATPDDGSRSPRRLAGILGASAPALGQAEGRGALWQPIEPPTRIESPDKLQRTLRYIWLNCCRPWRHQGRWIQLVDDPLQWPWSTLHDSIGAIVNPWVPADRVARALEWPSACVERLFHYAVSDDHVAPAAQAFPLRPAPSPVPDRPLANILAAALATTRLPTEALQRRTPARQIAIGLARRQGWTQATALAPTFATHRTSISRIATHVAPTLLETAALCLDPRMHPRTIAIPTTGPRLLWAHPQPG
ncbi:MAG: hypothetical protein R3B72_44685 [Polyangiaceae bacterium]